MLCVWVSLFTDTHGEGVACASSRRKRPWAGSWLALLYCLVSRGGFFYFSLWCFYYYPPRIHPSIRRTRNEKRALPSPGLLFFLARFCWVIWPEEMQLHQLPSVFPSLSDKNTSSLFIRGARAHPSRYIHLHTRRARTWVFVVERAHLARIILVFYELAQQIYIFSLSWSHTPGTTHQPGRSPLFFLCGVPRIAKAVYDLCGRPPDVYRISFNDFLGNINFAKKTAIFL